MTPRPLRRFVARGEEGDVWVDDGTADLEAMIGVRRFALARLHVASMGDAVDPSGLTPAEARRSVEITHPGRRRDWVAGRRAAKEAIRRLLVPQVLDDGTISIETDDHGAPCVRLPAGLPPCFVSIAHGADVAVAIASERPGFGIDVERVGSVPDSVGGVFATPDEIGRIATEVGDAARARALLWTAKEAALKAVGAHRFPMSEISIVGGTSSLGPYRRLELASPEGDRVVAAVRFEDAGLLTAVAWLDPVQRRTA